MKKTDSYRTEARKENLDEVVSFVMKYSVQFELSERTLFHIRLAIEEIFVNICVHAYGKKKVKPVQIDCGCADNRYSISIRDQGKEFNPLLAPVPDTEASMEDRKIGGLGIFLTRAFIQDITYFRDGVYNVTVLNIICEAKKGCI